MREGDGASLPMNFLAVKLAGNPIFGAIDEQHGIGPADRLS